MKDKETTDWSVNERVKIIRNTLGMTQQAFADAIKLKSGNTFSMIERKECAVTEQNILLLCTPNQLEVGKIVNENWLRTGKGEMFVTPIKADGRLVLLDDKGEELPPDEGELIGVYRELIPENKKYIRDTAKNVRAAQENMREYLNNGKDEKGDTRKLG